MAFDKPGHQRQQRRNRAQALLLIVAMLTLLGVLAWLLLGPSGAIWALVFASFAVGLRPSMSPQWLLAVLGSQPLSLSAAPELHRAVRALARRGDLARVPELHRVRSSTMNAFAVGRSDQPVIALTDGLLRRLTPRELMGVLAHEVAHVRADDMWIMSMSDVIARVGHGLAFAGLLLILSLPATGGSGRAGAVAFLCMAAPTLLTLLQLGLSRAREYDADLQAVAMTGDPLGLAAALQRLDQAEGRRWERTMVLRRYASDPLLLRTHPLTAERVRRLAALHPTPNMPRRMRMA